MLTITDLYCGAGGSGLGAHAAGYRLVMAANHWAKAIETHAANFPDTEHDCADISQVDPRRYATTDVLWASPECTNHSQAKGVRRTHQDRLPDEWGDVLPSDAAEFLLAAIARSLDTTPPRESARGTAQQIDGIAARPGASGAATTHTPEGQPAA